MSGGITANNGNKKINTADRKVDVCFIDIKLTGFNHQGRSFSLMEKFYKKMLEAGVKVYSRQSIGFYHSCYLVFDIPKEIPGSTTRLTPGINPEDNQAIINFMNEMAHG